MIKNRNVSIITDENNNQIVIINDKKFKGLSKDDWQQIEKYLKGYISDCYEITETNDVVYIGKEFPSEYAGSKSRIALKGARKKAKASGRISSVVLPSASCCLNTAVCACRSASGMAAYFSSRASTCLAMGLIFFSSRSEKLPKSFSTRDIGNTS